MITTESEALDEAFAALADPTRRAILSRLARGEASVNELAEPFAMTVQAVSKHLKVLERAGLIERHRDGQRRPCRLWPEPLEEVVEWVERHREIWEERFDRLDAHLRTMQAGGHELVIGDESTGRADDGGM